MGVSQATGSAPRWRRRRTRREQVGGCLGCHDGASAPEEARPGLHLEPLGARTVGGGAAPVRVPAVRPRPPRPPSPSRGLRRPRLWPPPGEVHNGVLVPVTSRPPREGGRRPRSRLWVPGVGAHGERDLALEPGGILHGCAETPPSPARPWRWPPPFCFLLLLRQEERGLQVRLGGRGGPGRARALLKGHTSGKKIQPRPVGYPRGLRGPEKLMIHVELQDLLNCC